MRLRQICLVAHDLDAQTTALNDIFGIEVGYRDPGVAVFGLNNIVVPVGGEFLEIVSPIQDGTAAGRYLERRGGDSGYMVILQTDDAARDRQHIIDMGIRMVWPIDRPNHVAGQFHPGDLGGILLSVESQPGVTEIHEPMCDWPPAGPDWRDHVATDRVSAISGAEIQAADPPAMAAKWAEALQDDVTEAGGFPGIRLADATLRFVPLTDERGPGLAAVDLLTTNRAEIVSAAKTHGYPATDNSVTLCGTVFHLK
jgi:hypothetical protein